MANFNPQQIEQLAINGKIISSENGRVSGVTYRERYRLADGRYLDVTRDTSVGNHQITEYAIRKTKTKNWQVSL